MKKVRLLTKIHLALEPTEEKDKKKYKPINFVAEKGEILEEVPNKDPSGLAKHSFKSKKGIVFYGNFIEGTDFEYIGDDEE